MDLLVQKKVQVRETEVISSSSSLVENCEQEFTFNTEMLEFLRAVRNQYRIYVVTNLGHTIKESDTDEAIKKNKEKVHEMLLKLCKQDIIKGAHRLMYSFSEVGHIAQIRHLGADLHIECDFQIVKSLLQHMNKFHLVGGVRESYRPEGSDTKEERDSFITGNKGKVVFFKDAASYSA